MLQDRAATVPTALAHLEQQTLPAARFEIVAIDHGSSDGTLAVLERYAAGAPVRIQVLDANAGNFARARNLGLQRARGRWLVFLDQDVLASPNLLERYLREFEAEPAHPFLLGQVALHPQLPGNILTRLFLSGEVRVPQPGERLNPREWHGYNFGASRALLRDQGGFDEELRGPDFLEIALAERLAERGILGRHVPKAYAYEWRGSNFEAERARCYARGRALHRLERSVGAATAAPLLPAKPQPWPLHQLLMPFYVRACRDAEGDVRYAGALYKRVLVHDLHRGYADARKGRARTGYTGG